MTFIGKEGKNTAKNKIPAPQIIDYRMSVFGFGLKITLQQAAGYSFAIAGQARRFLPKQ